MYQAEWVNKQVEKNLFFITMILTDSDGILPSYRIDKAYDTDEKTIDEAFLAAQAEAEITRIMGEI